MEAWHGAGPRVGCTVAVPQGASVWMERENVWRLLHRSELRVRDREGALARGHTNE